MREQTLDFLVVPEEMSVDTGDVPTIYLTETKQEKENTLYRYQSADILTEQISAQIYTLFPDAEITGTDTFIVYAPLEHSGKTSLALEICKQIAGSLYVGMECFSSMGDTAGSIEELLYAIMQSDVSVSESLIKQRSPFYNSYMLTSPDCYCDLKCLDYAHMEWFLSLLKSSGQYQAIVLDVGCAVFDDMKMLDLADRLLVVKAPGEMGTQIFESMKRGLKKNGCTKVITKMEVISLPYKNHELYQLDAFVRELLH